ncbi:MAG: serine hydrolase domain-containing protein [Polyangiaceae bacterium]
MRLQSRLFTAIALTLAACNPIDEAPALDELDEEPIAEATSELLSDTTPEGVFSGTSLELDTVTPRSSFSLPPGKALVDIVGVAIRKSDDHVYYFFADGTRTEGTSTDPDYHEGAAQVSMGATGFSASQIVGVGISTNSRVHYWFASGNSLKVTEGWSKQVDLYSGPANVTLPPGKTVADLVGIDFNSNDTVYAWYKDGTVSHGTRTNLAAFDPNPANLPTFDLPSDTKPAHIRDIAIAGNDRVYTWIQDLEKGVAWPALANSVDPLVVDKLRQTRLAAGAADATDGAISGMTVAVTKNGRLVLSRGYGYANIANQDSMLPTHRARIGSVGKMLTTFAILKQAEVDPSFSVDTKVYGPGGVLATAAYQNSIDAGMALHKPLVGTAIGGNSKVYAWYANGYMSIGTSTDLDQYTPIEPYSLPPGQTASDVLGIAIASTNKVYSWYRDGTRAIGTPQDLGAESSGEEFAIPKDWDYADIAAIGIRKSDDHVFSWHRTGKVLEGNSLDLNAVPPGQNGAPLFTPPPGYYPWSLVEADFAPSGVVYYHWKNRKVSSGTVTAMSSNSSPVTCWYAPAAGNDVDWHPWFDAITVRHLLSHSSGFDRDTSESGTKLMFGVTDETMNYSHLNRYFLSVRAPLFAPGTSESYSNHGFGLLGHILEQVSGEPYEDFVRDNILTPAGIPHVVPRDTIHDGRDATPYKFVNGQGDFVSQSMTPDSNGLGLAAGGWVATADDLARLLLAVDGLSNHPDILSSSTLVDAETRPFPDASDYALGWRTTDNLTKLAKDGSAGGGKGYIAKYKVGYLVNNVDVGGITVSLSVSGNPRDSDLALLADQIAKQAALTAIDSSYDQY